MKRYKFNERKLQTLRIFKRVAPDWLTPRVYGWKARKLPVRGVYSYLAGLWRWGLLARRNGPVRYRITPKGRQRLDWLRRSR